MLVQIAWSGGQGRPRLMVNESPPTTAPPRSEVSPAPADVCPACGAARHAVLFSATDRNFSTTARVFEIVECGECRLIRLHPQPDPSELAGFYPAGYWDAPEVSVTDRLEQWYRRFVLSDHARFVERALMECDEPGMVLDVGCGAGLFLQTLRRRGTLTRQDAAGRPVLRRIAGVDFSLDAAVAAARNRVPAVCASLSKAPFAAGSCAVVTMFNVLEHLYDPASHLDAARGLLAPHGRLIVQVPNAASWQFLLMGERWSGLDVPRHLFHFRLSHLEALLGDCGFEILRYKHFSLRDNPAGLAASLAPALDPTVRRLRHVVESPRLRLFKDGLYLGLVAACLPPALFEAACRAGSTVILEARKKT